MASSILRWLGIIILVWTGCVATIELTSSSWPSVEGNVLVGRWSSESGLTRQRGEYEVRYAYDVNGKSYTGYRIGWAAKSSVVKVLNIKDERQPREGDRVMIYYAPWMPSLAVLVPGHSPGLWIWVGVCVMISGIFFGFSKIATHPIY